MDEIASENFEFLNEAEKELSEIGSQILTQFSSGIGSQILTQFSLLLELLVQVFSPIFWFLVIVRVYYETRYFHRFIISTWPEIKRKENPKQNMEMENEESIDEVLEKVTIDTKEKAITN